MRAFACEIGSIVGWVERIPPTARIIQKPSLSERGYINRKPSETQRFGSFRNPGGLKLGFTAF